MFSVYILKNGLDIFYVGSTSNVKDRRYRHLSGKSVAKACVTKETTFEVQESFQSKSEAIAYETALTCFFSSEGHKLENKYYGIKYSPNTKLHNKGVVKNKSVSPQTAKKISESKSKLYVEKPYLLEILKEENEKRKKKVFRSDGRIYTTTESCMKDLKISGKKFKSLITEGTYHKGYKISFIEKV